MIDLSLLQKELKNLIPNIKCHISGDTLKISDFEFQYLLVEVDNGKITLWLKNVQKVNQKDLILYLKAHLDLRDIKKMVHKDDAFYLYPKSCGINSYGIFEKRMFYLRILKEVSETLKNLYFELNFGNKLYMELHKNR